jgi:hypothetical protein
MRIDLAQTQLALSMEGSDELQRLRGCRLWLPTAPRAMARKGERQPIACEAD